MSQTVYMYKCTNTTLKVHGKVNSIVLGELGEGWGGEEKCRRESEGRVQCGMCGVRGVWSVGCVE